MTMCLLSQGAYSDKHVLAVYTTKELATEAARFFSDTSIEEVEVDVIPDHPPGFYPFEITMKRDGEVPHTDPTDAEMVELCPASDWGPGQWMFRMWARDEKHAVKIANERRAFMLANNLWIDPLASERDAHRKRVKEALGL